MFESSENEHPKSKLVKLSFKLVNDFNHILMFALDYLHRSSTLHVRVRVYENKFIYSVSYSYSNNSILIWIGILD